MEQTTARLRKTFRYPSDNDSENSLPEVMDEEEQETLIRGLQEENNARNKQYARLLLAFPLLSTIIYLPTLFDKSYGLISLLSISSLLSTAYLLFIFPPEHTGLPFLDAFNSPKKTSKAAPLEVQALQAHDGGPIAMYLPYLNTGLCVVLSLLSLIGNTRVEVSNAFGLLPAGVYVTVLVAKSMMASVNPERELEGLKYGFKGA
ncbi:hypothetical protein F5884DRAFT_783426 [Xylogone sp. PMI_703]|nr:hypothetical protein F5884DRAFT_783426 [Xylogone sp. PMI_703]